MFSVVRRKGLEIAEWDMRRLGELAESGEDGDEVGAGESAEVESGQPAWAPAGALDLKANGRRRDEEDEDEEDEEDEDPDFAFDELDEDEDLDDEEEDLGDYDDEDNSDEEDSKDQEE